MSSTQRSVRAICDRYVDDYAALDPVSATEFGIMGHESELPDYSPAGYAARAELARRALAEMAAAEPVDEAERVAKAVFTERVSLDVELYTAGLTSTMLNVMIDPLHSLRVVFDLMPTETPEHWAAIESRLRQVPAALAGMRVSLLAGADNGRVSALRQVSKVADQCETWAGLGATPGFFTTLVADGPDGLAPLAHAAEEAFAEFAGFLRAELAPLAPTKDAVGEDVYRLWSRFFLGADLDLHEAYAWGWAEFARIETEMRAVADRIKPGATVAEAAAQLDDDPRYQVSGRDEFLKRMQAVADDALNTLRDKHFDIPDRLMTVEARIAPSGGNASMYYTAPTEDFSRPGRMWWSLPADKNEFTTWREVSIVYHEGAPGHHLQIGTAVNQAGTLTRYQRLMVIVSGHCEGWALYAELLMGELGYLSDDGYRLGMLAGQLFRAARVIVDLGMHLELEIPAGTGFHEGERWTPELGLEFLLTRTVAEPSMSHAEIDRYLGWPGQAPSYKLGERLWLAARDDVRARQGDAFDIKAFHKQALEMGGMGLDTLREQLARLG
ncbi:DUF885 domain-containing protein [Kutzneria chonburiensis]|uniref:DUF885 domain-containing protein n=1 Tax=Kutzneria chonburiensis TaxID=1483604 RepID=A0ABV6N0V5_9PSEU|nr:DUF885 domain-containing protein [Kutzneria chonburiensis]